MANIHTHIHYRWAWDMSDCSQNMHNMKPVRKLKSLFMTSQNIIIIYRNYGWNILNFLWKNQNFDKFCDLWVLWMQMEFCFWNRTALTRHLDCDYFFWIVINVLLLGGNYPKCPKIFIKILEPVFMKTSYSNMSLLWWTHISGEKLG